MLDYKAIGRMPDSIRLTRNRRELTASRALLGEVCIRDGSLWIADSAFVTSVPPLPIRVADGKYAVYAYQWEHAGAIINVCAVLSFRRQQFAFSRRLKIHTEIRPDLTKGIIVDTAEITIQSDDSVTMQAGLGDGYYPVIVNYNFGIRPQSVIVDFKIWEYERVFGRMLDEYGIVRFDDNESSDGSDDSDPGDD